MRVLRLLLQQPADPHPSAQVPVPHGIRHMRLEGGGPPEPLRPLPLPPPNPRAIEHPPLLQGHRKITHGIGGHARAHFDWVPNAYTGQPAPAQPDSGRLQAGCSTPLSPLPCAAGTLVCRAHACLPGWPHPCSHLPGMFKQADHCVIRCVLCVCVPRCRCAGTLSRPSPHP